MFYWQLSVLCFCQHKYFLLFHSIYILAHQELEHKIGLFQMNYNFPIGEARIQDFHVTMVPIKGFQILFLRNFFSQSLCFLYYLDFKEKKKKTRVWKSRLLSYKHWLSLWREDNIEIEQPILCSHKHSQEYIR